MGVKLAAALGGSVELVPTNTASNYTVTLPASTGTVLTTTSPKTGNVLQVLSSSLTTTLTMSTATWVDTGMTITITPSSTSSRILLQWAIPNGNAIDGASNGFNLVRDGTNIAQGTGGTYNLSSSNDSGGNAHMGINAFVFLDSPSTTSAITYKVQAKNQSGCTGYINRSNSLNAANDVYASGTIANFVAMEIA